MGDNFSIFFVTGILNRPGLPPGLARWICYWIEHPNDDLAPWTPRDAHHDHHENNRHVHGSYDHPGSNCYDRWTMVLPILPLWSLPSVGLLQPTLKSNSWQNFGHFSLKDKKSDNTKSSKFQIHWKAIRTLSDKISADKNFGGHNFSADEISGTKSNFRQFYPTIFFHGILISPYNSQ